MSKKVRGGIIKMNIAIIVPVIALIALAVAAGLASWISKVSEGNEKMSEIAGHIRDGAMAFLRREYKTMAVVVVVVG